MTTATTASEPSISHRRGLSVMLWLAQIVLAAMFGMAGVMKSFQPISVLSKALPWAGDVPALLVRFIGASELAAALGLILPAATRIAPRLTPLAALGLLVVMVLAAAFHIMREEFGALPFNFGLGALAAFVAWGRLGKAPLEPRGR